MTEERTFEQAVNEWTDAIIECRSGFQHAWFRSTVFHHPGRYTIRQRCLRCGCLREHDLNEQGYVVSKWRRIYADGYLLKGVGRLDEDHRATLRLLSLRDTDIVEVED